MHSSIGIQVVALSVALLSVTLYAEAGNVQLDYSVTDENRSCANPGEQVTFTCMTDGGVLIFIATRFPSDSITFVSSDEVAETVERSVGVSTFTATLTEVDDSVLTATLTVVASEEVTGTVGCTDNVNIQEANLCLTAAPETPRNLEVTLMRRDFLLLSWDPPSNLPSGVETTYNVTVVNPANGMVYPGFPMNNIASTSVEFEELETSCQLYEFNVTAENSAGSSDPAVIRETIPISPDVTSVSVSLMATVSFDRADILLSLTFNRAIACSTRFGVESYNISLNGEIVMEFSDPGSDPVNITLSSSEISALLPDTEYNITVTACSSLTCRQAEPTTAVTTDVQSASVTFVETRVLLSCELAEGSPALGCVFIFTLNSKTERFNVSRSDTMGSQRRRQMDTQAEMCQTTRNLPDVYDSVTVVDWESDGSEGTLSMTVVPQEDPDPDNFVCPDGTADQGSDIGMIVGAVVGIVGAIIAVIGVIVVSVMVIKSHKRKLEEAVLKALNKAIEDNDVDSFHQHLEELERRLQDHDNTLGEQLTASRALCYAARVGSKPMMDTLIKKGVDVNTVSEMEIEGISYLGESPLHLAATDGNVATVKYFVDHKADVNIKNKLGMTPLHWAARHGNFETMRCLVDHGADVNIKHNGGKTPLHEAARGGNPDAVEYLVDKGADVNIKDDDGRTPLHEAAHDHNLKAVKYLAGQGADVNTKDNDGRTPLHEAAHDHNPDAVKYLVVHGADVNIKDNVGRVPLHKAARQGNLDTTKYLVDQKADVNIKHNGGETPLHLAARVGHLDTVKYLIEHGADVNIKTNSGRAPLHKAARQGNLDTVRCLVDHEADVNIKDDGGETPLYKAAASDHLDVVKYLVDHKADVNIKTNSGETPLDKAAAANHHDVVKYLEDKIKTNSESKRRTTIDSASLPTTAVELKEDVLKALNKAIEDNDVDSFHQHLAELERLLQDHDNTVGKQLTASGALCYAAKVGSKPMMDALIEKGVDVNAVSDIETEGTTYVGSTPLHLAARDGNLDTVIYLVDHGADVNVKKNGGRAPLHKAALCGNLGTVKYLVGQGADVNIKDNYGRAPLHYAAVHGNLDAVKHLADQGADANIKDNSGSTPLHYAARDGHLDTVKYLVDPGAGVNLKNNLGRAPLHEAACDGSLDAVKHLVDQGGDVNIKDNGGSTPLHEAVRDGYLDTVRYLVDHGADVNIKDKHEETPLDKAAAANHHDVVKYLTEHGGIKTNGSEETPLWAPQESVV